MEKNSTELKTPLNSSLNLPKSRQQNDGVFVLESSVPESRAKTTEGKKEFPTQVAAHRLLCEVMIYMYMHSVHRLCI